MERRFGKPPGWRSTPLVPTPPPKAALCAALQDAGAPQADQDQSETPRLRPPSSLDGAEGLDMDVNPVGQPFQAAVLTGFPARRTNWGLESPQNRQAGMPALRRLSRRSALEGADGLRPPPQ